MLCDPPSNHDDEHYLDNAAIAPLRPAALDAMVKVARDTGNPSSVHSAGRRARCRLEECREEVADLLGARPTEVIFVGSGTEADNIALHGMLRSREGKHSLITAIEHHAVKDTLMQGAQQHGCEPLYFPLDSTGRIIPDAAEKLLHDYASTLRCIATHAVNNEIGVIQPVEHLAHLAEEHGVSLHIDAVQAVPHIPSPFLHSGVTTMAIASQKFGGPTGVGVLLARRDAPVVPSLFGGGQERGLRPGTQNLLGIVGLTAALQEAYSDAEKEEDRLQKLRRTLWDGIRALDPTAHVNGCEMDDPHGAPTILSVAFPGCEGELLVMLLDGKNISVSLGSACHAGVARASEVLLALDVPEPLARGTIRLSLGWNTTVDDCQAFLSALPEVLDRARRAGLA